MKRRLISLLLAFTLVFSIFTSSFTINAFAEEQKPTTIVATVKTFGMNKIVDLGYRSIAKITNKALNATGNATGIDKINKVASIINTVLVGNTGKVLGEIKSLCDDILNEIKDMHADMEASFSIVEQMLGQQAASTARNKQDEKWNSDVMSVINEYNAEPVLEQYLEYMKAALDYSDDKTNTEAKEKYEHEKELMLQTYRLMYPEEISIDILSDPDKLQDVLFTSTKIDDSFINMISKLSANFVKGQNSSNITLAETAAMTANEYFPFSHQQYQFVHTVVGEQLMELTMCMLAASEFFDVQGEYILNKYGEGSPTHIGYINVVNQYYNMITGSENSVENRINSMLDSKMAIDKYNSKSLMDYMQPQDAASINMKIENFEKTHHFESMDNSVYVDKKFINDKVRFNRVMVNDAIYYIIDKDQFSDKLALSTSALEYKEDNGFGFDVHLPSTDYLNLIKDMSDGVNKFKVSGEDTSPYNDFIKSNSFALAGNIPERYLEGYFPDDGTGDSILITSQHSYHVSISMFHTQYAKYKVVDAKAEHSSGKLKTFETSAEQLQPPNGDNQRYSVILAPQSDKYQQNVELKADDYGIESAELVSTDSAGNETVIEAGGRQMLNSGDSLAINFKLEPGACIKSVRCVRDYDMFDSSAVNETEENTTVLISDTEEFNTIYPNEDGSYTINYIVPYSDSKIIIEAREKCTYDEKGFCVNCGGYEPAQQNDDGVYEIDNAGKLFWFSSLVIGDDDYAVFDAQDNKANGKLIKDIDAENRAWTPIGNIKSNFEGRFDGGGHSVKNLNGMLFGSINNASVKNVYLKSGKFSGNNNYSEHTGSIAGSMKNSEIRHCYSEMTSDNVYGDLGGLVGKAHGTISDCYFAGSLNGSATTGGIAGSSVNDSSPLKIENCLVSCAIKGGSNTGAFVGWLHNKSSVINSYYNSTQITVEPFGTSQNPNYLSSSVKSVSAKSDGILKSGEITYMLNRKSSTGNLIWYQNVDNNEPHDDFPKFEGAIVYFNEPNNYSNHLHTYDEKGFCSGCGNYQPACFNAKDSVYEIYNAGQLMWFACLVNGDRTHAEFTEKNTSANAYIKNDIDLEGREWTPIKNYSGEFGGDKDCQTISGFKITKDSEKLGFFESTTGYLAFFKLKGEITVDSNSQYIGGIAGEFGGDSIVNVISDVDIKCNSALSVGGVIGIMQNTGKAYKCMYTGDIDVTYALFGIGGIVGCTGIYDKSDNTISNCANIGTISGNTDSMSAGGIAGILGEKTDIINCYNYGKVSVCNRNDTSYCGAIFGIANTEDKPTYYNNYYLDSSAANQFGEADMSDLANENIATSKTAMQFSSGEVAYLLNSKRQYPNTPENWYQNIDNGKTPDDYPKFDGGKVYYLSAVDTYSNFDYVRPTEPTTEPITEPTTEPATEPITEPTTEPMTEPTTEPSKPDAFDIDDDGNLIIDTYDALVSLANLIKSDYEAYGSQNYILTKNIKAPDDSEWVQGIGSVSENKPFNGSFDGNGYCIMGLNVNSSEYGGLFEIIGEKGKVSDLFVFDCDFKVSSKVAGGISAVNNGTIDHCISGANLTTGTIHFNGSSVNISAFNSSIKGEKSGGAVGENNGIITGCRNASVVSGTQCGGIAAENTGKVYCCANNGSVGTTASIISGGLTGKNAGIIESSYNSGSVKGSSENTKGSIAGVNGYDDAEPTVKNTFYSIAGGLNAVGDDSLQALDDTNTGMSNSSDFKTDSFVDKLNAVSDESVVWIRNSVLNKGYPTIKGSFIKISLKSAGNNITVEGGMHEALNIKYNACSENEADYKLLYSSKGENKILKAYSVSLTDNDGNYIPAELWCQEGFKISVPVDNDNVEFAGIDADGQVVCYKPDSVKNGIAVFTVPHPMSFAIVESQAKNVSGDNNNDSVNDNTAIQTGTTMFINAVWIIAMLSLAVIFSVKRRNKIG